jgi:MoaA/NifB/PqqE/SkfB family radical SAM enzyme
MGNPNSFVLQSLPRGADKKYKPAHACDFPYNSVTINSRGECYPCFCEGYLPYCIGNVMEYDSLHHLFANPVARMVQQDVDDKKFTWCAVDSCGIYNGNLQRKDNYELWITIDPSCNLACPSCRREKKMYTQGPEFDRSQAILDRVISWLQDFPHPVTVNLTTDGDPLASHIFRPLIKNYQPGPKQRFRLTTNGLLMKKLLPDSTLLPHIDIFSISIDAASKQVYEDVRRPGKWENILENLDWLRDHRDSAVVKPQVLLIFVLQNNNYQDLPAFARLVNDYGFRGQVSQLVNWYTWSQEPDDSPWTKENGTFRDQEVLNPQHDNFYKCLELLLQVRKEERLQFDPYISKLLLETCDAKHPYYIRQLLAERVGFEPTVNLRPR